MAKQLLIETRMNALSLCEGVEGKAPRPGCLGTLSGPCADFINPTRNNNFYKRKLWENVFKDPLVKESLEDRVLIGELDHPGDRLETKATNAAIVMTGYEFDDNEGVLNGTFDILDTPNGKILRSLLDYGCKIGVSSRGEGDVTTRDGVDEVDETTYYFVAFDAVVLPAVKKAKPTLQESLKRESLKESLLSQVESATTKSELDLIKKVVEATELPDVGSLMESIENKSKELEGVNDSSRLLEDLEKSMETILSLTEDVKRLNQEVANCKSRIRRFVESRVKINEESRRQSEELNQLYEDYNDLMFRFSATSKKLESVTSRLSESMKTNSSLEDHLAKMKKSNQEASETIARLSESLNKSQSQVREKSKTIESLNQDILNVRTELSESKKREQSALSVARKAKVSLEETKKSSTLAVKEYAKKRASEYGISPQRILESVKSDTTTSDIDSLLQEELDCRDRYRRVPVTTDPLLVSLSESVTVNIPGTPQNDDVNQTVQFMEQFYKL